MGKEVFLPRVHRGAIRVRSEQFVPLSPANRMHSIEARTEQLWVDRDPPSPAGIPSECLFLAFLNGLKTPSLRELGPDANTEGFNDDVRVEKDSLPPHTLASKGKRHRKPICSEKLCELVQRKAQGLGSLASRQPTFVQRDVQLLDEAAGKQTRQFLNGIDSAVL